MVFKATSLDAWKLRLEYDGVHLWLGTLLRISLGQVWCREPDKVMPGCPCHAAISGFTFSFTTYHHLYHHLLAGPSEVSGSFLHARCHMVSHGQPGPGRHVPSCWLPALQRRGTFEHDTDDTDTLSIKTERPESTWKIWKYSDSSDSSDSKWTPRMFIHVHPLHSVWSYRSPSSQVPVFVAISAFVAVVFVVMLPGSSKVAPIGAWITRVQRSLALSLQIPVPEMIKLLQSHAVVNSMRDRFIWCETFLRNLLVAQLTESFHSMFKDSQGTGMLEGLELTVIEAQVWRISLKTLYFKIL